jgi:transcriptional regulator with XRE-family HTH domain
MSGRTLRSRLGKRVAELRTAAGFSQDELARLSGLSRFGMHLLEAGTRAPRIDSLAKVARALRVPLRDLVDVEQPHKSSAETRIIAVLRSADPKRLAPFERIARAYFGRDLRGATVSTPAQAAEIIERVFRAAFGRKRSPSPGT